jgi:hypothetical protein
MTDYTTLSGAEFRRAVGTDPDKWAEAMLQAMQRDDAPTADAERIAFVAAWLHDYGEAVHVARLVRTDLCAATDASDSA